MKEIKLILTAVCALALGCLTGCAEVTPADEIKGYPVYKFINLDIIDVNEAKTLKASPEVMMTLGADNCEALLKSAELYATHGLDRHTSLKIRVPSGEEVSVYVPNDEYMQLWKTNPHDLAKQGKSHRVTIKFVEVTVGERSVKRAVSFQAELVDAKPIIRK